MKIGIIGLGKLGLPLAVVLSKHFKIYGVDLNPKRIQQILNREPFFEPKLNEYLEKHGDNLTVSLSYEVADECDLVFILTQTPSLVNGKFDLQYVGSALTKLNKVNPNCLAVISSTINIGDMQKLRKIHLRICYNPEFIRQGSIIRDFENPKFILIGAYDRKDGELLRKLWGNIHRKPVHIVTPVEAEIAKLTLNVSFTLGITFANIIGELSNSFNANPQKILKIIYGDRRDYTPGLGFSGPCFNRDVKCFQQTAKQLGLENALKLAFFLDISNNQIVQTNIEKLKSLGKKKIGFLGISYKANVPYVYNSQPLKIAEQLAGEGFEIYIYDKHAEENAKKTLNKPNVHFCSTLIECIENAEALFIGTANYSKPTVNPWK